VAFFVAFYSYKGGVGRSMALANVAYSLAERGKRVVLLDMDLEAPSLHDIPEFALRGEAKKGLIEYATSYRQTGKLPALKSYIHRCRRSPGSGELWLMPAGRMGPEYQQQLGDLSWRRLHQKQGTQPFVDGLRQAIEAEINPHYVLIDSRTGLSDIGGLSTHLLADMVVLVFNLTPASIEGSVRTYRSFTTPGSRVKFVQLVASPVPPGEGLAEKRIQQAGELMQEATVYGRSLIRVDYNPAMVLAEELAVRTPDRFPAAARYLAIRDSVQRANSAEVFPVVEQAQQLRSEGRLEDAVSLLRSFITSQPQDLDGHLALGNLLFEAGRYPESVQSFTTARDLSPHLTFPQRRLGEALAAAKRPEAAIEALQKAAELGDQSRELYQAQARAYAQKNDTASEIQARSNAMMAVLQNPEDLRPLVSSIPVLRREFIEVLTRRPPFGDFQPELFWEEVMGSLSLPLEGKLSILRETLDGTLRPTDLRRLLQSLQEDDVRWVEILGGEIGEIQAKIAQEAIDPWDKAALQALQTGASSDSIVLGLLAARSSNADERASLLRQAIEKDTSNAALLYGLGVSLGELADLANGEERKQLLLDACQKYQAVSNIKPDKHEALYNWGIALGELAELAGPRERKQLLLDACQKYQEASNIKPEKHEALFNWAVTLGKIAEQVEPQERKQLLLDASQKYQEVINIKPNEHDAFYNWSSTVCRIAAMEEGPERRALWQEAARLARKANELEPGEADYNLACALSQLHEFEEASALLQADLQRTPSRRQHALDDPDLVPLWQARPDLRKEVEDSLDSILPLPTS
jgi:CobQ/CobB/MinD/ParA nucleotide binding domain/Plant specific mitochondrial import receptor subunit TOM20/Tetratrico peptide repeat